MNILWQHPDGTVAVTHLLDPDLDPEEHAADLVKRGDVPTGFKPVAYAVADLPHHWPIDVWHWKDGQIVLHVERARAWHKARLRRERVPALAALDIRSLRNGETGADNAATLEAKQVLRDITRYVDVADTWEAMNAITVTPEQP